MRNATVERLLEFDAEASRLGKSQESEFYRALLAAARCVTTVDAFYVCHRMPKERSLAFAFQVDEHSIDPPGVLPIGTGPTSWVVDTGREFLLDRRNQSIQRSGITFGSEKLSQSILHVPILLPGSSKNEVIGALSIQSYEPDNYGHESVLGMRWLSGIVARWVDGRVYSERWQLTNERRYAALMDDQACLGLSSIGPEPLWLRKLTNRQIEVLDALVSGEPYKVFSKRLNVKVNTIDQLRRKIASHMGVDTRAEILAEALPYRELISERLKRQ